jgi:hypothetical protein
MRNKIKKETKKRNKNKNKKRNKNKNKQINSQSTRQIYKRVAMGRSAIDCEQETSRIDKHK